MDPCLCEYKADPRSWWRTQVTSATASAHLSPGAPCTASAHHFKQITTFKKPLAPGILSPSHSPEPTRTSSPSTDLRQAGLMSTHQIRHCSPNFAGSEIEGLYLGDRPR